MLVCFLVAFPFALLDPGQSQFLNWGFSSEWLFTSMEHYGIAYMELFYGLTDIWSSISNLVRLIWMRLIASCFTALHCRNSIADMMLALFVYVRHLSPHLSIAFYCSIARINCMLSLSVEKMPVVTSAVVLTAARFAIFLRNLNLVSGDLLWRRWCVHVCCALSCASGSAMLKHFIWLHHNWFRLAVPWLHGFRLWRHLASGIC